MKSKTKSFDDSFIVVLLQAIVKSRKQSNTDDTNIILNTYDPPDSKQENLYILIKSSWIIVLRLVVGVQLDEFVKIDGFFFLYQNNEKRSIKEMSWWIADTSLLCVCMRRHCVSL